jgi:hypothetical protein
VVVMLSATAVWGCHGSCLCCGFYAVDHCGDIVAMGVVCVVVAMLSAIAVLVDMASVCVVGCYIVNNYSVRVTMIVVCVLVCYMFDHSCSRLFFYFQVNFAVVLYFHMSFRSVFYHVDLYPKVFMLNTSHVILMNKLYTIIY